MGTSGRVSWDRPSVPLRKACQDHRTPTVLGRHRRAPCHHHLASRDGVEIHLGVPSGNRHTNSPCSAYLFVDDADDLAAEWRSAAAGLHPPEDTDWGQHEGALVDFDGNVIRFGSPIQKSDNQSGNQQTRPRWTTLAPIRPE